ACSIGSSYRATSAHPVVKTQKSQAPDPELMVGAQDALGIDVDPNRLLQCADVTDPPVPRLGFDKEVEPRIPESRTRRPRRETAAGIRFGPHDDHRASVRKREDNLDARARVSRYTTDGVAARVQRSPRRDDITHPGCVHDPARPFLQLDYLARNTELR